MKKAFTLLELLIIVVIIAILMGFVFALSNLGSDSHKRTITVMRMQKLENCLSGYYAAFGNYPPVKVHGSRNIYNPVNNHGIHDDGSENRNLWNWNKIGEKNEREAWAQVKAACKAQPVDCRFPYPQGYENIVAQVSEEMKYRAESGKKEFAAYYEDEKRRARLVAGFDSLTSNERRFSGDEIDKKDWREIQIYKFGLMSFLLPRYLVMMNGHEHFIKDSAQWNDNNTMPSNPFTGETFKYSGGWTKVRELAMSNNRNDLATVANIPDQAVCARWIANLSGLCHANRNITLFGVNIKDPEAKSELTPDNVDIEIFSSEDNYAGQYILDGVTVRDGWGQELYYYSPAPYQRYTLWSAGPNGRTFPPWVVLEDNNNKANECIGKWTHDDIVHLRN